MTVLRPEHWLMRLQTEGTLAHSAESRNNLSKMFGQAILDCYSIPILTEWCTWSISTGDTKFARANIEEVLHWAGSDPLSGKIFWSAKLELEKSELDTMRLTMEETERAGISEYEEQKQRVLWCFMEILSRPFLRDEDSFIQFQEFLKTNYDSEQDKYLDEAKSKHDAAMEYLEKLTVFEDKLLTITSLEERGEIYQEYIKSVKESSQQYPDSDSVGMIRALYDRASHECRTSTVGYELLVAWAHDTRVECSRRTYARVLQAATRRSPRKAMFWVLSLQQAEHEGKSFDEVKEIFEHALTKVTESYKDAESVWLSYLEYVRRRTSFDNNDEVEKLRRNFRLAWDSLAEVWGHEANDCEVPLYWARLEYKRMNEPKQGKEIFEEIFKYGENKTMSKYWESLLELESTRTPKLSDNKLRDLMRRALRSVEDYPPSIARIWTNFERDYGQLQTLRECLDLCDAKVADWRKQYQMMKETMTGKKQKGKKQVNKKPKKDKPLQVKESKGKRKLDSNNSEDNVKRIKEDKMEVDQETSGLKRPHEEDEDDDGDLSKRQRTDDSTSPHRLGTRDACTLFVSNLEFKVNEQNLRDKLSQYGSIISLRVRKGIKAFGGSICYCQYKTTEAVDEALKHDRTALDGRPMFFSRYSAKKNKPTFKYSTEAEKNKLFVKNLPFTKCNKNALGEIFDKYGKVKDIRVVTHKDGKPKGLAYVEYEDESSAAEAVAKAHGMLLDQRKLDVALSAPPPRAVSLIDANVPALGQLKRDGSGGMRRTQLSSFIPSVLQKPSTSGISAPTSSSVNGTQTANGNSNGSSSTARDDEKRPLSNSDFRSLLLSKK